MGAQLKSALSAPPSLKAELSSVLSPLVIEPDGTCVPFEFGFPREYVLGNVQDARLRDFAEPWWLEHAQTMTGAVEAPAVDPGAIVLDCYQRLREQLAEPTVS